MSIKVHPVWLIKLRGVSVCVFRVEVLVRCGNDSFVVDHGFLIRLLSWERVTSRLLLVDISVLLLLDCTYSFVVLLELLGWGEPWQQREIRCHRFCNLRY